MGTAAELVEGRTTLTALRIHHETHSPALARSKLPLSNVVLHKDIDSRRLKFFSV